MAKEKFAGSVFLISIMILSVFGSAVSIEVEAEPTSKSPANGLTPREPIYIDKNEDFTAENGVTRGSGTKSDPYIIERWVINASKVNGITIHDVNVYFIIRHCEFHDGISNYNDGIDLWNVSHGTINSITSYRNHCGVFVGKNSNIKISNCITYNNTWGIFIGGSSDVEISKNAVYNNIQYGLYFEKTSSNKVHYCNIYDNVEYGIYNYDNELKHIVDATNCWWGSANGPSGAGSGSGDAVSNNVRYIPWLREPVEDAGWEMPKNVPPTVAINSPRNGEKVSGTVTVQGTASDPDGVVQKVELKINSGDWVTASGTTSWTYFWDTTTVSEGNHTIYARSYDGEDYSTIVSVTVTVSQALDTGGEEGEIEEKEEMPKLETTHLILIIGIIAALIIVAGVILGRRKILKAEVEKPAERAGVPTQEPPISNIPAYCPKCKTTFQVEPKERPFKVKCPSCGTEGMIR